MTSPFTVRQGQVLAFIHGFIAKHGVAPSYDEIAAHFGTTSPSVNGMIKTLERRGLLSRIPGVARSLRVLVPPSQLPSGEFGSRARAPSRAAREAPAASALDAAAAAAVAVLDVVMPLLTPGARRVPGEDVVMEAAHAVCSSLTRLGLDETASVEAARRVAAEAARWTSDGRGAVVRRRQWTKR
jgi:hypothetical protein